MDKINKYHKEIIEMWPMLFFCDTLTEKLEHIKETIAYVICRQMSDPLWQPIMHKRCIELSQLYMYVETLHQNLMGLPKIYKELP